MEFKIDRLPREISPCPITEAVVEIRFESNVPSEVIPGLLYNKFPSELKKIEKLPILQLPAGLIDNDPNLRFGAHYKAVYGDFIFQFGPRSVSVSCVNKYVGWTAFSAQIKRIFDGVFSAGLISKPQRIGLRYISFLAKQDIYKNIQIELNVAGNSLIGQSNIVRSEFDYEGFRCAVQIANSANLKQASAQAVSGSSIDIDIIASESSSISVDRYLELVEKAHNIEKKLFFSLLKPEFLNTLNPQY